MQSEQGVTDELRERIVIEAANGRPLREIAKLHSMRIADVVAVLDAAADEAFSGEQLRREWFLEAHRLRKVIQTHFLRHTDVTSAVVMIKASERLSALLGLNAQQSYSVQLAISNAQPTEQPTSTAKMLAALKRLRDSDPRRKINGGPGYGDDRDMEDEEVLRPQSWEPPA